MSKIHIGWQTNGLKSISFEKALEWASKTGIETVEMQAWPNDPFCNVNDVLAGNSSKILKPLEKYGIEPVTLMYCVNHLNPNQKMRNEYAKHMKKVIESAQTLEIPLVSCFIGSAGRRQMWPEMAAFEEHFLPILEFARDHDVKMAIENCPSGGNNIANNPKMWNTLIFEVAEEFDNLGLEFDPSHLVWLMIDWESALEEFLEKDKVFCCHAKDTEVFREKLAHEGIYCLNPTWKKARMPGLGEVDWKKFMEILKKHEFEGSVIIEHEDRDFSGNKYQEGVEIGVKNLR